MADITITIPTELVARVSAGLGVSTIPEAKAWVIAKIKEEVLASEQKAVEDTEDAKLETARQARETAVQAVTEVTLS